jgi:hypothetical protein
MSDEKPFAEAYQWSGDVWYVGSPTRDADVYVGETSERDANDRAAAINAAYEARCQARERKAAAKALREIAKIYERNPGTMSHWDEFADDLRSRASAIEKGEA